MMKQRPICLFQKGDKILELRIEIAGIQPPIYRKLHVPDFYTMHQLHYLIQLAFDWKNAHLYSFFYQGREISTFEDDFNETQPEDATRITLKEVLKKPKEHLLYVYDFGDNWEHDIRVEKVLEPDMKKHYPQCISGQRKAPPEDVGGILGFEDFVEIVNDMEHEEHDEIIGWYGGFFDELEFSRKEVNANFRAYVAGEIEMDGDG